jgi:hypothetical protein
MTDPRPAPDESSGVPVCVESCQHYSSRTDEYGDRQHQWCDLDPYRDTHADTEPCLPRIRDLVAISRRRCDGCQHWSPLDDGQGACDGFGDRHATYADEVCSRWRDRP